MRPYVSFSEWGNFRECQQRWRLDYVEGHRRAVFGIHLDFGVCIHEAIEHYKTRKDPVTLEQAIAKFQEKFLELHAKNHDKYSDREQKQECEDFVKMGTQILQHFDECKELAEAAVIYNEKELFLPIDRSDGLDIKFKGYIDMVIKTKAKNGDTVLYIVDFKTCSWGWDREKRQDKHLQAQLFLYKHFLCKEFSLDPKQVRCAFVLLKKKPRKDDPHVEFMPISAGPVSVQRALDDLNTDITYMKQAVESGNFVKNRKACVNAFGQRCAYLDTNLCPAESTLSRLVRLKKG
ncbi:MAG: PD-(D/E)XK nuclease family protein [Acidiferrobacterales bacterium]